MECEKNFIVPYKTQKGTKLVNWVTQSQTDEISKCIINVLL